MQTPFEQPTSRIFRFVTQMNRILLLMPLLAASVAQAQNGLRGDYFSDKSYTNLVHTQVDKTIDFAWRDGLPRKLDWSVMSGVGPLDFGIRWTGYLKAMESGIYTITMYANDGAKVWLGDLNGAPIINQNNFISSPTGVSYTMVAGQQYPIKIEYFQNNARAEAQLRWKRPGSAVSSTILQSQLNPTLGTGTGLKGEYFSDASFINLVKTQTDPTLNFDWGNGSPTSGVGADNFSVRWSGQIEGVETGTYTLAVVGDETAKVWVQNLSGAPLINHTGPNGDNPTSNTFAMRAGQLYDIQVDYTEGVGPASLKLFWTRPGGSSVIVPQTYLHPIATLHPATQSAMRLPLEVMGAEGTQVSLNLPLTASQASSATQLWLQTHNLRYAEKASFQINGGGWIPLNNSTATLPGNSGVYGGIGGSIAVLKMTLPIAPGQLIVGNNTINFRFNVSNGLAVGYRIVNLNLLDSANTRLIADSAFTREDPATWQPPSAAQADISAGETLWRTAPLVANSRPGAVNLSAKCASCHMQDGRDLKYFNYSNHSIIERSKFHGLNAAQGAQIASYIRTRPVNNPGRPWNPPYQPGPGTSDKPNSEWLAGAGIENILEDDADTLQSIFPNGVRRDALMEGDTNKFKRYSSHDTALAFQLPDWNHWLPEIHPVDAFPAYFATSQSLDVYNKLRTQLVGKSTAQIREWMRTSTNQNGGTGYFLLKDFYGDTAHDFADQMYPGLMNVGNNSHQDAEVARQIYSFVLWKMVKHVEIQEEFALTGLGKVPDNIAWAEYESRDALPRMWLGANRSVFDSSPFLIHLEYPVTGSTSGNNGFNYSYISNSWYQLQLILNGGQRTGFGHKVVDFGYAFQFTSGFEKDTGYTQLGRHYVWCLKGMDEGDNDRGPNYGEGWSFNRATIDPVAAYYAPSADQTTPPVSSFSRAALAMLVQVWLEKSSTWLPEQIFSFPDGTPKSGNEDGVQFDLRTWVVGSGDNDYQNRSTGQKKFGELASAKALGSLPAALQNGYAQWAQVMWPGLDGVGNVQNNWMQFAYPRVGTAPSTPTLANSASYGDIRVSWTHAPSVTSYNVKRSTSPTGPFLTVAYFRTTGEYTDSVPLQNREYYYKLSANTAAGESNDSAAALTDLLANRLMGSVIGSIQNGGSKILEASDGDVHTISFSYENDPWTGLDLGTARSVTRIGYVPQRAYSHRMIGGKFQGSNSANFSSGVVDLLTLNSAPGDGYKQQTISVPSAFRYLRYLIPAGGGDQGEFAEMTFWGDPINPAAPSVSSALSASGTVGIAINNYTITASNNPTSYAATNLPAGLSVNTSTGVISGTPTIAGTFNSAISANNASGTGTATLVFNIDPPGGSPVRLSGTIIGTLGTYSNGNTREKAFDGNTSSFFDAADGNGNWAGLDLGTAQVITQVRYFPRSDQAGRMNGGLFQGSNTADFSSGVVTLHTISGTPPVAFATVTISNGTSFRYVRYLAPNNSYGNVAELEFYRGTASTSLQTFRTTHGVAADGSQDLLTPAGDGTANLLKFAFNMIGASAGQAASLSPPNAAVLTPTGSAGFPLGGVDGAGKLQLTYIRRKAASNSGITYAVEFSPALTTGSWATNSSATEVTTSLGATFERVTVTDSLTELKRFVRVKITGL